MRHSPTRSFSHTDGAVAEADRGRGPEDHEATQAELVHLIAMISGRSCAASFERLYGLTHRRLFGVVLRINSDRAEAEEVLQETYLTIWKQSAQFDSACGQPIYWLSAIARNNAITSLRERRKRPQLELKSTSDRVDPYVQIASASREALDVVSEDRQGTAIRQSIRRLSCEQRESLSLAFYGGLSHGEIAHRLGRPVGTIKSWIRRSLMSLRPELSAYR